MIAKFLKNQVITDRELKLIVEVKSTAWPYPESQQIDWIKENLEEHDLHLLLLDGERKAIAYANLVKIDFEVNDEKCVSYGVGNVCSTRKGKGYGGVLMEEINSYFLKEYLVGLLFCKKELINFYEKYGWSLVPTENCRIENARENISCMIFNYNSDVNDLRFSGKLF